MVKDEELFDRALGEALESYVSRGVRGTTSVLARVRLGFDRTPHKGRRRQRPIWLLPAAAIIAGLLGGAAYAAQALGAPVVIKFLGWPKNFDISNPTVNVKNCVPSRATTLADAQRAVTYQIIVLASVTAQGTARLTGVSLGGSCSVPPNRQGVSLNYLVDGVSVQLSEGPADNANGPLVVGIKGNSLPPGMEVKVIDGQQYAVWMMPEPNKFNSPAGVTTAQWQTGATVVNFNVLDTDERGMVRPVPWQTFEDIVQHLR